MIVAAFDRNENRWVALAEIDWVNDRDFDFGTSVCRRSDPHDANRDLTIRSGVPANRRRRERGRGVRRQPSYRSRHARARPS